MSEDCGETTVSNKRHSGNFGHQTGEVIFRFVVNVHVFVEVEI